MRILKQLFRNDTPRSIVNLISYKNRLWAHKIGRKYLLDNEEYALNLLAHTGYVPECIRKGPEELLVEYIPDAHITDPKYWLQCYQDILDVLLYHGIRHGDLTEYALRIRSNHPIIIDWSSSRLMDDPRPDKRPEGDAYWLKLTMEKMVHDEKFTRP